MSAPITLECAVARLSTAGCWFALGFILAIMVMT